MGHEEDSQRGKELFKKFLKQETKKRKIGGFSLLGFYLCLFPKSSQVDTATFDRLWAMATILFLTFRAQVTKGGETTFDIFLPYGMYIKQQQRNGTG